MKFSSQEKGVVTADYLLTILSIMLVVGAILYLLEPQYAAIFQNSVSGIKPL